MRLGITEIEFIFINGFNGFIQLNLFKHMGKKTKIPRFPVPFFTLMKWAKLKIIWAKNTQITFPYRNKTRQNKAYYTESSSP